MNVRIACVVLLVSVARSAEASDVKSYYSSKINEYEKSALNGSAIGALNAGWMHMHGKCGVKGCGEALKYLQIADSKGEAEGTFLLGKLYNIGHGTPVDLIAARRMFKKASENGHREASHQLSLMFFYGEGGEHSGQQYRALRQIAFASGNNNSIVPMAPSPPDGMNRLHEQGIGLPKWDNDSLNWYGLAASNGVPGAVFAVAYLKACGTTTNLGGFPGDAVSWLRQAVSLGCADAYALLASLIDPLTQELTQKRRGLLEMGLNSGSPEAVDMIARDVSSGLYPPPRKLEHLLQLHRNHVGCRFQLGICYLPDWMGNNDGVPEDLVAAVKWFSSVDGPASIVAVENILTIKPEVDEQQFASMVSEGRRIFRSASRSSIFTGLK